VTSSGADFENFGRRIEALTPWLDQVVIIGGWAHRLYRLHPSAQQLDYRRSSFSRKASSAPSSSLMYGTRAGVAIESLISMGVLPL
jgi:hypothetical protein